MRVLKTLLMATALTLAGLVALLKKVGGSGRNDSAPLPQKLGLWPSRQTWKIIGLTVLALLLVAPIGGFFLAASGLMPIKASSGHWAITAWFLNFSMARSVDTHSLPLKAPSLDDPMLVHKGAGHFALGCQPCHGSPMQPSPVIPRHMTPHPPYLPPKISEWEPAELFYIVKHGVKFTGMPAWAAQHRDDEIWAVTAFLLRLPELSAEEYVRLTQGKTEPVFSLSDLGGPESPALVLQNCARCHGFDGLGRGLGAFPKLAGQHKEYLEAALAAYAGGARHSGIMQPISAALSKTEISQLAEYYSSRPAAHSPAEVNQSSDLIAHGRKIALEGIPKKRVPACAECHGPNPSHRNPHYPILAGQYAAYLELQLDLFQKKHRCGSEFSHLMHPTAERLTAEDVRAVAAFYESLGSITLE